MNETLHPLPQQTPSRRDGRAGSNRIPLSPGRQSACLLLYPEPGLAAILFLYKEVLKHPLDWMDNTQRAKKPTRLPLVFTREEVRAILIHVEGSKWIVGALLYGAGLRLLECLRLRVKDIDFGYKQITVRDGKGAKDRITTMIYTHVLNKGGKGVRSPIDQF
jgi:integrase